MGPRAGKERTLVHSRDRAVAAKFEPGYADSLWLPFMWSIWHDDVQE